MLQRAARSRWEPKRSVTRALLCVRHEHLGCDADFPALRGRRVSEHGLAGRGSLGGADVREFRAKGGPWSRRGRLRLAAPEEQVFL
jgi:hypothetical protein